MNYIVEDCDLRNFPAWGQAKDTIDRAIINGQMDDLEQLVEDVFCDKTPTDVEINDFLAYDDLASDCSMTLRERVDNIAGSYNLNADEVDFLCEVCEDSDTSEEIEEKAKDIYSYDSLKEALEEFECKNFEDLESQCEAVRICADGTVILI